MAHDRTPGDKQGDKQGDKGFSEPYGYKGPGEGVRSDEQHRAGQAPAPGLAGGHHDTKRQGEQIGQVIQALKGMGAVGPQKAVVDAQIAKLREVAAEWTKEGAGV